MYAKTAKELKVYKLAYKQAMDIQNITKSFPKEEKYSLVSQIRRSSRSVCSNLREAWSKRRYISHFINKITDCDGENSETETWIEFSKDFGYINQEKYKELLKRNKSIGRKLGAMINKAETFCGNPRNQ